MKPLKPAHREKKRYLLIKGKDADKRTIEEVILEFIGILGFAEASPNFISSSHDRVVMAINRSALDKVRSAFVISDKDLKIIKVSGSLIKVK